MGLAWHDIFNALPVALLVSVLTASCSAAAPIVHAGLQLTPETFASTITDGPWLLEFYSPWCGHCKAFAPTWKKLVDTQRNTSDARFAQIDCAAYGDLCNAHKVKAYPSIKLFYNGVDAREFPPDATRDLPSLEHFIARYAARISPTTPAESDLPASGQTEAEDMPAEPTIQPRQVNAGGEVLSLNKTSLSTAIGGELGPVFIKFFAPWCGHCKAMAPAWKDLASESRHKINIAELDCDVQAHRALCVREGVKGFPTLFMYVGGNKREYLGARTTSAMRLFAERAALSSGLQALPVSGLSAAKRAHNVLFLLLNVHDAPVKNLVNEAALTLFGAAPVFRSESATLDASLLPARDPSTLVVFKAPLIEPLAYRRIAPDDTSASISSWLRDWRLPIVSELTSSSISDLLEDGSGHRLIIAALPSEGRAEALSKLQLVAEEWNGRGERAGPTRFAWADALAMQKLLKAQYGIKSTTRPSVVLVEPHLSRYFASDMSGAALALDQRENLFHALESHNLAQLRGAKNSLSKAERGALVVGKQAQNLFGAMGRHPVKSALLVSGFFLSALICLVRNLDASAGRPLAKTD